MTALRARLEASLSTTYHVDRERGSGGIAVVYLAHDLRYKRRVALKVLRPEISAVVGPERFLREIETLTNLIHPHHAAARLGRRGWTVVLRDAVRAGARRRWRAPLTLIVSPNPDCRSRGSPWPQADCRESNCD